MGSVSYVVTQKIYNLFKVSRRWFVFIIFPITDSYLCYAYYFSNVFLQQIKVKTPFSKMFSDSFY